MLSVMNSNVNKWACGWGGRCVRVSEYMYASAWERGAFGSVNKYELESKLEQMIVGKGKLANFSPFSPF